MELPRSEESTWLARHKTLVVNTSAVICGVATYTLTFSPPTFAIYATTALTCHFVASHSRSLTCCPSLTGTFAYSLTTVAIVAYNALQDYKPSLALPHIVRYDDAAVPLIAGAVLLVFGLKLCELCGNWKTERSAVRSIELSAFGISLYGSSMGLGVPNAGSLWRYAVALQVAALVFNSGIWLDGGNELGEDWADEGSGSEEKAEKEKCQV